MRPFGSRYFFTLLAGLSATTVAAQVSQSPDPVSGARAAQKAQAVHGSPDGKRSVDSSCVEPTEALASGDEDATGTRCLPSSDSASDSTTSRAQKAGSAQDDAAGDADSGPRGTKRDVAGPQDAVRTTEAMARDAARRANHREEESSQNIPVAVPYNNIPALRDLYMQVPSSSGTLRRFGSEAFLLGTGNANLLPSDLPVGPDYVLGSGDQLVVNMWGSRSARLNVTIDRQGQIALPEVGTLVVSGLTVARAQEAVQKALNTQLRDEHAEISMGRVRTVRVYVVGDVQRPGAYDVNALSTPLSALYAAGGPTARGSLRLLKQMRGERTVAQVDLYDFLIKGVRGGVERLQPGDTLVVPPVGVQVAVEGAVHHPAIYELNGETNLKEVLNLAGGALPTAQMQQLEVSRVEPNARRTMVSLHLPGTAAGNAKVLDGFAVQNQDHVTVPQILPYNQQAVFLAGHVFRPGQYAFQPGLTVTDILRSYQDVLPEPADRGEIVRLVAPDLHPVTIPFRLADVLMGNSPIALQPFDTVEVFGRYAADAPRVRVEGEVLHPGLYPLSAGMTASQLVELAGGLNRSAFRDVAGLASYTVVNGQSVELGHTDVPLAAAMSDDHTGDAVLKPGDVLSIRQVTGWTDIGGSVTVTGEVAHPGGYGLATGERLSSVLKRAGGLRPEAFPEAANFSRVQVKTLEEKTREEMIERLEAAPLQVKTGVTGSTDEQQLAASLQAQRVQLIAALRSHPATGRMVVNLGPDISRWEGTPDDIVLRAGDTLVIPKRPSFVLIAGQVYNPTAVTFLPGHDAAWYLNKGGGATRYGDRKRAYVLRADGSVVAHDGFGRGALHTHVGPGDAVIVPEKLMTGNGTLRDVLASAQIVTSVALAAAVAGGL